MHVQPIQVAIVEDDPGLLRALTRLLRVHGFHVGEFTSAESFLASGTTDTVNCLLVDIHLGGLSGIELRRTMIASMRPVPTIFMTAVDDQESRSQASEAGCTAYLVKPFHARDLMRAIRRACDTR